uniref:Uncharacterized protein n=1 Tax=Caenorhabditis japonica TaxID=281687 RepID=A0A8R1IFY5_CAEJA
MPKKVCYVLSRHPVGTLILFQCSSNPRPTENRRRRLDREPKIDADCQQHYVPLLPEWDSQLPEVFDESVQVQAKVKSEDSRETSIDAF